MSRVMFWVTSILASLIMAVNSGCASGGYKLTRQLAGWLNKQMIVVRVVLYILGAFVFGITMLIDVVIFNTIDFWEGKVSAHSFEKQEGDRTYFVKHEYQPGTQLRQSSITVTEKEFRQDIVLKETPNSEIELYVDGQLKSRVSDIHSLPVAKMFNEKGQIVEEKAIWTSFSATAEALLARR